MCVPQLQQQNKEGSRSPPANFDPPGPPQRGLVEVKEECRERQLDARRTGPRWVIKDSSLPPVCSPCVEVPADYCSGARKMSIGAHTHTHGWSQSSNKTECSKEEVEKSSESDEKEKKGAKGRAGQLQSVYRRSVCGISRRAGGWC